MSEHAKAVSPIRRILVTAAIMLCAIAAAVAVIWLSIAALRHHPAGGSYLSRQNSCVSDTDAFSSGVPVTTDTTSATAAVTTGTTANPYLFKHITFSSPSKRDYTTTDSSVAIMGSSDPKLPLTMNGKPVPMTEIGTFAVDVTLTPGKNSFEFSNGKEKVTQTITYRIELLRSVSPTAEQTVEGNSTIQFRAVARKGATVRAAFHGQTKNMTVIAVEQEEGVSLSSDFTTYAATFNIPTGQIGKKQSLGAATVTASLNGLTASLKTGSVTVNPKLNTNLVIVTRDYAETFAGDIVNDNSRPTSAYLPAGTIDQIIGTGSAAGHTYYHLGCGRWVYTDDAEPTTVMKSLTENALSGVRVSIAKQETVLSMDSRWKIPYNLVLLPQQYAAPNAAVPSYAITAQTTEYLDLTFYYTKGLPDTPDMSRSPLFSSASWRHDGAGNAVLRLNLKHAGQFYGYSVQWVGDTLRFSFKHPSGASVNPSSTPLRGIRIVLDPGHGGKSSGTYGTIKGLYEKTVALDYSLLLRDKLKALGATVDMTRTTDVLPDDPTMATRTAHARNNHTDLLLSIHMNGSTASSASGCSLHYFNEYSYTVAQRLAENMQAVESAYGVGKRSKVIEWSPFFMARVHDCPAVLIECGFMTNAKNMSCLVDPVYRDKLLTAITSAVVSYFRSIPRYTVEEDPPPVSEPEESDDPSSDPEQSEPLMPPDSTPEESTIPPLTSEDERDDPYSEPDVPPDADDTSGE